MDASSNKPRSQPDQRKALEESERNAKRKQPENYQETATEDKVVEIGPDLEKDPIRGIDAPESREGGR